MNINMKNLCNRSINAINDSVERLQQYDYHNTYRGEIEEHVNEMAEEINSARIDLEFMHEELQRFMHELKERKTEGEAVIDEILEVLAIGGQ